MEEIMVAQVILFENANFHGAHKHVFVEEANLNAGDDSFFNDKASSMVIVEGSWTFWRDANFHGPASRVLGPGTYAFVEQVGIPNDSISSLSSVRHG
jgi:hypothetical protein